MDGQEYLNQISAQSRPVKKSGGGLFSSKILMVGLIGVVLFVVILIFGALLRGNKSDDKTLTFTLKYHIEGTMEIVQKYQPIIKSSVLRSSSASLYSILSNTDGNLNSYIAQKYSDKDQKASEAAWNDAQLARDALDSDLFHSKINGTLDRTYAFKMAYEISLIKAEEVKLANSTDDEFLITTLTSSYNSLENLYNEFNNFSEAN